MKLRNKISGEIKEFALFDGKELQGGATLESLTKEWEDAPEEPKESEHYWYIGYKNDIRRTKYHHISDFADNQITATRKEIGNCFESLEEAELALRKLKAWKRLKDKGFEIYSWDYEFDMVDKPAQTIILRASAVDNNNDDLDLLFGGEDGQEQ